MKRVAVILAGGKGERFWPKSRKDFPKQFLSLTNDGKTMLQHTAHRLLPLVDYADIYVVTNETYIDLVKENLPDIPKENILCEPVSKNTAPSIGLAAAYILKKYEDAMMFVMPADHLIKYDEMYLDTLRQAEQVALEDCNLMTIGITPTYPETGYGYIKFGKDENSIDKLGIYSVQKFVEKPTLDIAKDYLNSGQYLWNSGMFVWKASSIMENFKNLMSPLYTILEKIQNDIGTEKEVQTLNTEFQNIEPESIDYGIMEHAQDIYTLPGNFGWDDVGSWLALERIYKTNEDGNVLEGEVLTVETKNSIIVGDKKMISTLGLDNIIVVDTEDATLICEKSYVQDIKKVLVKLREIGRQDLT